MIEHIRAGVSRLTKLRLARRLEIGALFALAVAGVAAAAPLTREHMLEPTRSRLAGLVERASLAQVPTFVAPPVLVWQGEDLDGDGQQDFANPTGKAERRHDAYGDGEYGASRDGGVRRHEGVDFMADAGQAVEAPISGFVTKIGYAYPSDSTLRFVEITNPALHLVARVFYVNPSVEVGDTVAVGRPLGVAHTLQDKYPGGMTDHVHLEIQRQGRRIDATTVIEARYVPQRASARTFAAAD